MWQVVIDPDSGEPADELTSQAIACLKDYGLEVTKASEISPKVPDALDQAIKAGIAKANSYAVSNAAKVRISSWYAMKRPIVVCRNVVLKYLKRGLKAEFWRPHPCRILHNNSNSFLDIPLNTKLVPGYNIVLYCEQILK